MNTQHEFSVVKDKQILIKLIEVDDELNKESTLSKALSYYKLQQNCQSCNVATNTNSVKPSIQKSVCRGKDSSFISGWFVNPGIELKKTEYTNVSKCKLNSRSLDSYDSTKYQQKEFIFYHYLDPRNYIEQYRKENTVCSFYTLSGKHKLLQQRSFYDQEPTLAQSNSTSKKQPVLSAHYIQPSESTISNQSQLSLTEQRSQSAVKICNQGQVIIDKLHGNFQRRFETSVKFDKDSAKDTHKINHSEVHLSSPVISIVSLQNNVDGKTNIINNQNNNGLTCLNLKPRSASYASNSVVAYQFIGHKVGKQSANQLRTMENCLIEGEKQFDQVYSSSTKKWESLTKAKVFNTDTDKIPEKREKVFFSDDVNNNSTSYSGFSNRAEKEILTAGKKVSSQDLDLILSPREDSKSDYGYKISPQKFLADSTPLLKAQAYKFNISTNCTHPNKHRCSAAPLRKKIFKNKSSTPGYKRSVSDFITSSDTKVISTEQIQMSFLHPADTFVESKINKKVTPESHLVPYFKFWNASLPQRSCWSRRNISNEQTLQQLTEWMIAEPDAKDNFQFTGKSKKAVEEDQVPLSGFSSGVWKINSGKGV